MMTAARLTDAAKEGCDLLAKGGRAAAEVMQSCGQGNLSLDAALDLSAVQAKFGSVISQLKVHEPDVRASYNFTREVSRQYLERRAAEQRMDVPGAVRARGFAWR